MSDQETKVTKAIVLDDDADTRFAISRILGKCGCEVIESESVEEVIAIIETQDIDVVFSDMRIPGEPGGEELLEAVQERSLDVRLVLMSAAMDEALRVRLINKGAFDCAQKPFFKEACQMILDNMHEPVKKSA